MLPLQRNMNLRKSNIAIKAVTIALLTMVISFCVPHHHHEEAVCIGNYDCKGEQKHDHQDDCGGEDTKDTCCLGGAYVDSRDADDDFEPLFPSYAGLAAVIYELIVCGLDNDEGRAIAYWQAPYVEPSLNFKSLRSPPVC